MGTRAVYTFKDGAHEYHVYKHWDGYPDGAKQFISAALTRAWPLPRFEPDDFAAAFVAANKPEGGGGDIRLINSGSWKDVSPWDIDYRYEITCPGNSVFSENGNVEIVVTAYTVYKPNEGPWEVEEIFSGTLTEFSEFQEVETE